MRIISYLITGLLLTNGVAAETTAPTVHDHSHESHGESNSLKLDKRKKWKGDTSLRQGMERIRNVFAPVVPKIHHGDLAAGAYGGLVEETGAATEFIFKNCKLKPEADAVLHVLLSRVLAGHAEMQAVESKARLAGARKVVAALEDYPNYFEHKGWKRLVH